ncbi:(Fe-S)-binding protein [Sinimarinibacterium flocculans]|uniref:(Fe-S)-binding protein n=1 Tax=Sinimarinibacterium flocculans TaxID=985250 RepID=UPI00248FC546|nr:(Fe-S)-binding protein [Sinimarinibacterium flocculans]
MSDALSGPIPPERPRVYFFATCVIDLFMPQAGLDAVDVLERCGVEVHFPRAQTCCGQPAYTTGFPEEAAAVAARQLGLFPQPWPIVVPSGSCGGMLRHHWPRLFADDPALAARAKEIASRTVEFSDYLANTLGLRLETDDHEAQPLRVALHTSCTARREMDTLEHGRTLLQQLPGVQRVDHDHESECCGFGGTFSVKHPEISAEMAADKLQAIRDSRCDAFASADCGCLLNLNLMLEKQGLPLRGTHLASLIRARMDAGAGR